MQEGVVHPEVEAALDVGDLVGGLGHVHLDLRLAPRVYLSSVEGYDRGVYGSGLRVKVMSEFRIWGRGSGVCRDATDLISRHI